MPKLFSYGTALQQVGVQLAFFGRRLTGVSDALGGYRRSMVADRRSRGECAQAARPIIRSSPSPGATRTASRALCSRSRTPNLRIPTTMRSRLTCGSKRRSPSGLEAWVYVDARGKVDFRSAISARPLPVQQSAAASRRARFQAAATVSHFHSSSEDRQNVSERSHFDSTQPSGGWIGGGVLSSFFGPCTSPNGRNTDGPGWA